ncbi:branched-chain amino acid transport system ATP-binding protein [Agromyces terreus]|uniref:Branched-chain amino acid transport system ATP-binding protein n=1 Tax=Agromyces terreus TaxID=424795 RepID=A0A9X2KBX1_9MICO|nr:ABC transporter ATP-binding protein [Agromyces terreus]MCP2371828.1 branched-chain amino acid transport system ATP-binding protein [Agromyces terreus]
MSAAAARETQAVPAPIVRLNEVGISFRGVRALDGISFDVPQGGVTAVIGPNGAGKTTLFNCISGIYRHEGEIELAGSPIRHLRAHQRASAGIARTFQTPTLLDDEDVFANVLVGTHAWTTTGFTGVLIGTPRARREEREARDVAWHHLTAVGLASLADRPAGALAHADRRRVEIARALAAQPRILMLDEPAAGLSGTESDELIELVREQGQATGMTSLLVEHDVALVMRTASWIAVLDAGKLLAVGEPRAVRENPAVIAAYLGADAEVVA